MQCHFEHDISIDEVNLRNYATWLMSFDEVGGLFGPASFIPELITQLCACLQNGELAIAMDIQNRINALEDAVYGEGESTRDALARMKVAKVLTGHLDTSVTQPPIREPAAAVV
ncbi:hypothetical protein OAJ57_02355 [Alphaproteobacteria bacterium]|nr:hypothetical protein [Alphaproteobacteria bacterium]